MLESARSDDRFPHKCARDCLSSSSRPRQSPHAPADIAGSQPGSAFEVVICVPALLDEKRLTLRKRLRWLGDWTRDGAKYLGLTRPVLELEWARGPESSMSQLAWMSMSFSFLPLMRSEMRSEFCFARVGGRKCCKNILSEYA